MGQNHAPQEVCHRVHQRAAQEQGQPCAFKASLRTQLHHEHLFRIDGILLLRQQAGGIACTHRKDKATGTFLTFLIPNSRSHSPFIVQSVKSQNVITLDGVKGNDDPDKRSIEEIVINEMNMDTVRSAKYNEMVEKAEEYYQLVKKEKENTPEAIKIKKELDDIESRFSDDPAYVALLKAERGK